jgi:PilZ domain
MHDEKRSENRIIGFSTAQVLVYGTESFGYVCDFGSSGLKFVCDGLFQAETPVQVTMNNSGQLMQLAGKIVHRLDLDDPYGGRYGYGVSIERKPDEYDQFLQGLN